jgi:hypothetical protein
MIAFEVLHGYEDSERVVYVPFSNARGKAKLLEKDYNELVKLHVGLPWKFAVGRVFVRSGGRNLSIARLLLDAKKGEVIRHIDHDPTNLIRTNLLRVDGHGMYISRDLIRRSYKHQPEIIHREIYYREGLMTK